MSEQARTAFIGLLVLGVSGWGIYKVLQLTSDADKKNLDGVDIDSKISAKYNINRYGNKGHEIISKSGKVLKVFNSKSSDIDNWQDAVKWGKKNLKSIKK